MPLDKDKVEGYWKLIHPLQENDGGAYCCSICGYGDWDIDPKTDKKCFNCGAKMIDKEN